MSLRFLVDEQLPPRLAEWLQQEGFDALHVLGCALSGASDTTIFSFAEQTKRVLISKDADFKLRRRLQVQVVWLRFGNISSTLLLARFAQSFAEVTDALRRGEALIEVY
jgi:predicted nuclease of predicted toxin-antitoxin system